MDQGVDRPNAITYVKGTAVVRQLAALIGADAVTGGLADYLTRFAAAGSARLDDLVGCWSKAAGRDLTGWAETWLREADTPVLGARLTHSPDGLIESLTVTQDLPRPHRVGVALYDAEDHPAATMTAAAARGGPAVPGRHRRLRLRRTDLIELTSVEANLPGLAGEPVPAAVFVNAGDRALAQVTIDDRSLAALAEAAFAVGDPLTEAACWNAAWHMVLTAQFPAARYAAPVARRLAGATLPAENLPDRIPAASPLTASAPDPLRRALLAGFAATAATDAHLTAVRALLGGAPAPTGQASADAPLHSLAAADLTLRAALVRALAVTGLAKRDDLGALTAADPAVGEPLRVTCAAARPDPAAKEAAWAAALDERTPQRLARAHAAGIWIAGQEHLLVGYRDRYFTEALPALNAADACGERHAPRLAGMLFPGTVDETALASVRSALDRGSLTDRIRAVLKEQEAELRTALTVKAAASA